MNSFNGREWELYDLDNFGSTEYDNLLINKDIDDYFNDIVSKPIVQSGSSTIKSNYNLNKFYSEYIEHNLIFIVVLIGIIIFLVIRHYVKDFDTFDTDKDKQNKTTKEKEKQKRQKQYKQQRYQKQNENEKIKNGAKILEIEKNKLINYKRELDKEKQQILTIIDELSNINEYENMKQNQYNQFNQQNQMYLGQDINTSYLNNYQNQPNQPNQPMMAHNDNFDDNTSNYYDVNKSQNDKTNKIDGLYIEPPFM